MYYCNHSSPCSAEMTRMHGAAVWLLLQPHSSYSNGVSLTEQHSVSSQYGRSIHGWVTYQLHNDYSLSGCVTAIQPSLQNIDSQYLGYPCIDLYLIPTGCVWSPMHLCPRQRPHYKRWLQNRMTSLCNITQKQCINTLQTLSAMQINVTVKE